MKSPLKTKKGGAMSKILKIKKLNLILGLVINIVRHTYCNFYSHYGNGCLK